MGPTACKMKREYYKHHSNRLGRGMELLIFGNAGIPALVFPTSGGRFHEFEDCGMVAAVADKIDAGKLQLFCVDSMNMESWYDSQVPPRLRIVRHMQYEDYLIHEIVPMIRQKNPNSALIAIGCSFGGYHAVNIGLRRPDIFSGFLSLSGTFDLSDFLDGYCDQDCYFHLPTLYLPNLADPWLGRSLPRREPETRSHPQRQGYPASALHLGIAQLARLAHLAAHGAALFVRTGNREQGTGNREQGTENREQVAAGRNWFAIHAFRKDSLRRTDHERSQPV
jgi:esterase/lipase superfamily enzyme